MICQKKVNFVICWKKVCIKLFPTLCVGEHTTRAVYHRLLLHSGYKRGDGWMMVEGCCLLKGSLSPGKIFRLLPLYRDQGRNHR